MHIIYDIGARSLQRSISFFTIIAPQQKLVTLNSNMNSANKAICYAEVIQCTGIGTQNVYFLPVEHSESVRK